MNKLSETIIADWDALLEAESRANVNALSDIVNRHSEELAGHFYRVMLEDETASTLLSQEQVKERLSGSMKSWIEGLCSYDHDYDLRTLIAHQIKIGEVHARIDVPVHLVMRGARTLKNRLGEILVQHPGFTEVQRRDYNRLFSNLMDLAIELMSQAYAVSHDRKARASEAYRLFSISQNLSTEREKQKAALLDWENVLMFGSAVGVQLRQLPRIEDSEFGLWFRHKGSHAFEGASEAELIVQAMQKIDDELLPFFSSEMTETAKRVECLREIHGHTKSIHYHLETLFEQNQELESGKDVLTRLFSRKFLPAVLFREIQLARKSQRTFAALSIDIDHFKMVNDRYGHEAGDSVLQQVAAILTRSCRSGDFVFRMGGEEFLIILVDIDESNALGAAEKIRKLIAAEPLKLPQEQKLRITVSAGLAMFDGHPDYQTILRKSDSALYQAKNSGRDRVCLVR